MKIKVASRGSKLALIQVKEIMHKLFKSKYLHEDQGPSYEIFKGYDNFEDAYEVKTITTKGDKLSALGKKQFDKLNFISDVEKCLLDDDADFAVHSAKDFPSEANNDLKYHIITNDGGALTLNDDILIFRSNLEPIFERSMKIGTSSLRRKMYAKQVLLAKNIHDLNGNIDSRLNKLESGEFDCIVLSEAGIRRLYNQTIHIPEYKDELDKPIKNLNYTRLKSFPAVGQGRLLVQYKQNNRFAKILKDCFESEDDFTGDIHSMRYFLNKIDADCNSAIGFYAHDGGHSGRTSIFEGQVFGLNSFLEFGGYSERDVYHAMESAFEDFIKKGGKELLDEHN
tara:strand:- start:723 stop:1739 length:1017 start_codon:yes stop_codon:yes gene_type:complete